MSSMKPKDSAYLHHILDAIEAIEIYLKTNSYSDFEEKEWDQAAVMKYLEIIAEAAKQMREDTKTATPEIPWKEISNFRNILIHEYFDVDLKLVWKVILEDLPSLKLAIQKMML